MKLNINNCIYDNIKRNYTGRVKVHDKLLKKLGDLNLQGDFVDKLIEIREEIADDIYVYKMLPVEAKTLSLANHELNVKETLPNKAESNNIKRKSTKARIQDSISNVQHQVKEFQDNLIGIENKYKTLTVKLKEIQSGLKSLKLLTKAIQK
jgi:hypothetical protein